MLAAVTSGLAFVQQQARLPAMLRKLTIGKRMIMIPSSMSIKSAHRMDEIRGATGGGHDEMTGPLLLDERISLAPMMEYTDRYEGNMWAHFAQDIREVIVWRVWPTTAVEGMRNSL